MKTQYIDLAAYRRLGHATTPPRRVDWLKVCTWTLTLALALSFWAYVYILVTR